MKAKTNAVGFRKLRGPRDPSLRRALLRAMKGALKRSVVLLPATEDEDQLQEWFASALGFTS
jgi:hypothetical protein